MIVEVPASQKADKDQQPLLPSTSVDFSTNEGTFTDDETFESLDDTPLTDDETDSDEIDFDDPFEDDPFDNLEETAVDEDDDDSYF